MCQSWRAAADQRGHGGSGGQSLRTQTDVRELHGPVRPTARLWSGSPLLLSAAEEPAEAILGAGPRCPVLSLGGSVRGRVGSALCPHVFASQGGTRP